MGQAEKYAWASLITTGLIFWWFLHRMLDGWSVVDQSPEALLRVFIGTVIMFIIAEGVIAAFVVGGGKAGGDDIERDERDLLIDMKAEQNASWFMGIAIVAMIVQMLSSAAVDGYEFTRFDLTSLPALFFVLYSIVSVATMTIE
ncbi:MAG: hypothetical protein AAGJ87_13895 [Pseudomonadota bacterium]